MNNRKEVMTPTLDLEWVDLIHEAKEIGLSIEEIKKFLASKSMP
ncbi:anti-repressor SinI family protein [Priestia sp. D51]|nr:anti-repressor SinI family protein [Priestia aryabhattai]MDE8674670.1 anti-repressor SinI family protein [Priestia aryabhattai]